MSKSFNPEVFLTTVHPNATYQDLAADIKCLRTGVNSRSEAIYVLIEENLD